jgi:DNA polymerase-1
MKESLQPLKIVFTWDSKTYVRRNSYSKYKIKGPTTDEEKKLDDIARPQFDKLRDEILPGLGFADNHIAEGLEADDLIAKITAETKGDYYYVVASRDNDLYQLLWKKCMIYDHVTKSIYTHWDFVEEWNMEPSKWALVKAIAGCTSDKVEGIKGVGEKTAAKFINGSLSTSTKAHKSILDNKEVITRNLELVMLPHPKTPDVKINSSRDEFDFMYFDSLCRKLNMRSFLSDRYFDRWVKQFETE